MYQLMILFCAGNHCQFYHIYFPDLATALSKWKVFFKIYIKIRVVTCQTEPDLEKAGGQMDSGCLSNPSRQKILENKEKTLLSNFENL